MKRKTGFMDFELFKKIVDESKGRTEFMYLANGMGDPLIHPKICEMIEYANKSGIRMLLGTNGILLNKSLANRLLHSGVDLIELSIDAATSHTYSVVRGGKNYEKVLRNVISFAEAKRSTTSTKPFTILQFIMTVFNAQEAEQFYQKFKGAGHNLIAFVNCHTWAGNIPDYGVKQKPPDKSSRHCRLLWNQLAILWNGDVTPCHYDFDGKSVFGNVNEKPIAEIWNSPKMVGFRKYHFSGNYMKVESCKNCCPIPPYNIQTFFGGMAGSELFGVLSWYLQFAWNANRHSLEFRLRTKAKTYQEFLRISLSK